MKNINFKQYGVRGKILVFFPGWISPIEKEKLFLNILSKKYRVVSVHLSGYLNARELNSFKDFSSLAPKIHALLVSRHLDKGVFVGFSLGYRLIMELSKKYPNNNKKIFIGAPVKNFDIPFWAKLILKSNLVINFLRKSRFVKNHLVFLARKHIDKNVQYKFSDSFVTLTGAFDSLVGLLKTTSSIMPHQKKVLFIYGEKDSYLKQARSVGIRNITIIKNAGHNCIRGHEKETVQIFDKYLHQKKI